MTSEPPHAESTHAESGAVDGDALRPVCTGIARDTATARHHLGVPDPEVGPKWSAPLAKSRDAARECTSVPDSKTDDVQPNTKMLEYLFDAYEQAASALSRLTRRGSTALKQWPLGSCFGNAVNEAFNSVADHVSATP
ncbi:hypothetical protein ACIOJD_13670 [Streptomyces sp. NPDC088116]|uniref:hypothetical protein n=1 Tax=Streptomyces sp. NPDC088116 TaxID=3365825 RepID=UPI0037F4DB16